MAQQHTQIGTAEELASYLAKRPKGRFGLVELPEEGTEIIGIEAENKPEAHAAPVLNAKALAALTVLDTWIAEGQSADASTRAAAEHELEEFKRAMNANRSTVQAGP